MFMLQTNSTLLTYLKSLANKLDRLRRHLDVDYCYLHLNIALYTLFTELDGGWYGYWVISGPSSPQVRVGSGLLTRYNGASNIF